MNLASLFPLESDPYNLLNGMFCEQLPPLLDNLINEYSSQKLIDELKNLPESTLFTIDSDTQMIKSLVKGIKPPTYIFGRNWAAESIKFFTIKLDESWRPLAIPNIKHSLMFTYNSLIIRDKALNELYSENERLNGKTSHSESPIIGRDGLFSKMLYGAEIENDIAIGYIGLDKVNKFFKESKLQRFNIESTYPFVLQIDLNKFFENIYTHLLAQIDVEQLSTAVNNGYLKMYLEWLDEYNQKINDNHTKGILQGPISSKVTAELLQLSIDQYICKLIEKLGLDVNFTRYVDDYRFFARRNSDLELIKHHLMKLFRNYELSLNDSKINIYKGFEVQKQAHIEEYPEIKSMLKENLPDFSFENLILIRETFVDLLEKGDISTIKALLSVFCHNLSGNTNYFKDNNLIVTFVVFLIKVSFVKPILAMHIYKLISRIREHLNSKLANKIWDKLFLELEYIEENFSDTDLEIWFFYTLANIGNSKQTNKAFMSYKHSRENRNMDLNVIILTVLLKYKSKQTNKKIELEIINSCKDSANQDQYWSQISQSKWWLPIAKLWMVTRGDVDNTIKKLFRANKHDAIQWDKLGIIEFLLQNNTDGN